MSGRRLVVSNTGPLIWLAKIGRLTLLKTLFAEVVIPRRVYEEAVPEKKSADSIIIDKAVKDGWIKVSEERREEAAPLTRVSGVHLGEAEAILLAQKLGTELIVDEREASTTAQIFGVRPMGTVAVLLLALARNMVTLTEFKGCLDSLIALGFWLSVDVYNKALEEAGSIARRG